MGTGRARVALWASFAFVLLPGMARGDEAAPVAVSPSAPLPVSQPASESAAALDEQTGLIRAPGWEMAKAHCGVCHSYRLVTANRGDRRYWLDTLRWMQRTQNLWPIEATQETALLDYLAANYNESDWGRRPGLSPALLPK